MKSSHVAVAGGVFVAVLVVCFAAIGFTSNNEAASKPEPVPIAPERPAAEPKLPAPKQVAAAPAERGYDGTAALARKTASAESVLGTWAIPAEDISDFGLTYRDARLTGERLVTVAPTGIRNRDARTGQVEAGGAKAAKDFPDTALSPNGDWAVQAAWGELTVLDTKTGMATKIKPAAGEKRTFTRAIGFDAGNGWCVVKGAEKTDHVLFRLRKGGSTIEKVATLGNEGTTIDFSSIDKVYPLADGRFLFDRPGLPYRDRRFQVWSPDTRKAVTLPAFGPDLHASVQEFRVSADGKRAVMFHARELAVVDLVTNSILLRHRPDKFRIGNVAFAPSSDRVLVAYPLWHSGLAHHFGFGNELTEPGHAWVLDLATKAAVGPKLSFADFGVRDGFRSFVVSADGSRALLLDTKGKAHLLNPARAFGANVFTAAPAAPTTGTPAPTPTQVKPGETDS